MILRLVAVVVLFAAGLAYAWLNGWLSRREDREHEQHAGRVSWGPASQAPQPGT